MTEEPPNPDEPGGDEHGENERSGANAGRALCADDSARVSECMSVLAHERRRHVLVHLRKSGVVELADLVEHVAARERDVTPAELDDETRRAVRIDLHHAQLPKLADAGVISYDRRSGAVRYHEPPRLERLLDLCLSLEETDTKGN